MQSAAVNKIELEYDLVGSGEPVLLISPMLEVSWSMAQTSAR